MGRKFFDVTANHYKLLVGHDDYYPEGEVIKCGGCNWEVGRVYLAADNQEDTDELWAENNRGLCGECLAKVWMEQEL